MMIWDQEFFYSVNSVWPSLLIWSKHKKLNLVHPPSHLKVRVYMVSFIHNNEKCYVHTQIQVHWIQYKNVLLGGGGGGGGLDKKWIFLVLIFFVSGLLAMGNQNLLNRKSFYCFLDMVSWNKGSDMQFQILRDIKIVLIIGSWKYYIFCIQ